ncbi:3-phosphoshikimate 1-carboxyvinyltransferase [Lentibacillus sp. CBA3610]|uniref:3-phosphoshikimate 1-carboxyvinyltransferase n=1 Tax=Lentibacillus sp. CBA3610 TaxID=2518176 RepID=UPI0015952136|nr:3-phosphoshikimate 1-carboxyvinyltransferase [Lentibacillus sp. CBA3610]QKY69200.1 3-phosphoshikimate 1-carboxyvinyltransferase [Lentibacillus sp. CBA3610]
MNGVTLKPSSSPLTGNLQVPGDKSISHRAVMLGALAKGTTHITNFLTGEDCNRTVDAFRQFGVSIQQNNTSLTIESNGPGNFHEPIEPLYFGNSGTTARLMPGILAGLPFFTSVYGDASLASRPMNRVVKPLEKMGGQFDGRSGGSYLPLAVRGGNLKGIHYTLPIKSAQVKSAVLLGGLFAEGATEVVEASPTRDHSENMLRAFGADISASNGHIRISNEKSLIATDVYVPGDISSAAFFMTAAAIVPGSKLTLTNVGLNHSRSGIIDVLREMGASFDISNQQIIGGEAFGDVTITHQKLTGTVIEGEIVPRLIDELPIIALAATQAEGTTIIRDAEELRVKETDRIKATTEGLTRLGAYVKPTENGMVIEGGYSLTGGKTKAYNDHRIAMMLAISSLITKDAVMIDDVSSINISYPDFFQHLQTVTSQ